MDGDVGSRRLSSPRDLRCAIAHLGSPAAAFTLSSRRIRRVGRSCETEGSDHEKQTRDFSHCVVADVVGCDCRGTSNRCSVGSGVGGRGVRADRRCCRRGRGLHGGAIDLSPLAAIEPRSPREQAYEARSARRCEQWSASTEKRSRVADSISRAGPAGVTQASTDDAAARAGPRVKTHLGSASLFCSRSAGRDVTFAAG